ncbi:TetR/AcrR family transcriptional regulator [Gordonia sp. ABSL1-1]|uniref:TetR/AcrR family transcriptional regulator n=1 Tax=Gordonia sp. ABSL1-1 TaxID=3053923 RepID=UPI002573A031|nr:TetR/AcrR family transcriptional regulator [Gordonia sp. ABSL1-1]MDL9936292.1 TetR/AcrR family transcriptional regulator [Gordonia sp. ABSL1-1]
MTEQARAPRRRSERSRRAILDATRALLLERGFESLTIEGVASAAGVGKQTIYRWWRNRTALVADVLAEDADEIMPQIDSGTDVADDVAVWAGRLAQALTGTQGQATVRTLSAAALEDPATAARFRAELSDPMRAMVRDRLSVVPTFDDERIEACLDAIVGGIVLAVLLDGPDYPVERAEALARLTIAGALSAG